MKKISKVTILGSCLLVLLLFGEAFARDASVTGKVEDSNGMPIPGLTVSLVHPEVGRSYPSETDSRGRFSFSEVPVRDDPYYIEVYWKGQLMYRDKITVDGDLECPPIIL